MVIAGQSDAVSGKLSGVEIGNEFSVFLYLRTCVVNVHCSRVEERLVDLGVLEKEIRHDDVAGHFHKATGHEVEQCGIVGFRYLGNRSIVFLGGSGKCLGHGCEFRGISGFGISAYEGAVCACGDVADSSHYLKLGCAFVDRCDTCVAVDAFAGIIFHEARAAVNLNAVIGVLIAVF